jgi:transposase
MKARRERRSFSVEFKREAVRQARERKNVLGVAKELGIYDSSLRRWVAQAEKGTLGIKLEPLTPTERQEFEQLRRENRRLQLERDFLKKATAFFAREPK